MAKKPSHPQSPLPLHWGSQRQASRKWVGVTPKQKFRLFTCSGEVVKGVSDLDQLPFGTPPRRSKRTVFGGELLLGRQPCYGLPRSIAGAGYDLFLGRRSWTLECSLIIEPKGDRKRSNNLSARLDNRRTTNRMPIAPPSVLQPSHPVVLEVHMRCITNIRAAVHTLLYLCTRKAPYLS